MHLPHHANPEATPTGRRYENHRPMPDHQLLQMPPRHNHLLARINQSKSWASEIADPTARAKLEYAVYLPKHLVRCILHNRTAPTR